MIIASTVHSAIVARARDLLVKRRIEEPSPKVEKTEKQIALDKFFSTQRFCEHHESVKELVGIMLGYVPQPPDASSDELFSIQHCRTNKCYWILLDGKYGFRQLEAGKYTRQAGCETTPSIEDATAYVEEFAKLEPEAFMAWCRNNLMDMKWLLSL